MWSPRPTTALLVPFTLALAAATAGAQCPPAEIREILPTVGGGGFFGDTYGEVIAADADVLAIGAPQSDLFGGSNSFRGAVYVHDRNTDGSDQWGEVRILGGSVVQAQFGWAVAVSGTTLAVGARGEAGSTGAVYVHERDQGGALDWGESKRIQPGDVVPTSAFGTELALDGDTLLVGTEDGFLHVFERDHLGADQWGRRIRIVLPSEPQAIALDGDTAVIGYFGAGTTGSVEVRLRDAGGPNAWGVVATPAPAGLAINGGYGWDVDVSGDTAVATARYANAGAGAAWVFERDLGGAQAWGLAATVTPSDAASGDEFGVSAALDGDRLFVGAPQEADNGPGAGAVYSFGRLQGGAGPWGEIAKTVTSNGEDGFEFGADLALAGDTLAAASPKSQGAFRGSVHVFDTFGSPTIVAYCDPGTTSNGCQARMHATGVPSASLGAPFTIAASDVEGGRQGLIFYGATGAIATPWQGGSAFLCVAAPRQRTGVGTSGGTAGACDGALALDWNAWVPANPSAVGQPFAAGQALWFQAWFRDPASPGGTQLSDGLAVTLCP